MKRISRNINILQLIENIKSEHIKTDLYTKQTVESLFRSLLETALENSNNAVILLKLNDAAPYQGLISRLKFSNAHAFYYDYRICSDENILLEATELEHDEFIVVFADRFSAVLAWNTHTADKDVVEGFCTLNYSDSIKLVEYLQGISYDERLDRVLHEIRHDRRDNNNFNLILNKLLASLENTQRDLICAKTDEPLKTGAGTHDFYSDGFLSVITHEMRNPLSVMDLYTRIINKQTDKIMEMEQFGNTDELSSIKNAASSIESAITRLDGILTELRQFSGRLELQKEDTDLKKQLSETINFIKPIFTEKGVNLVYEVQSKNDVNLSVDKAKINQVVVNLLKNALDATDNGGVVKLSLLDEVEGSVGIKIEDTGTGIREENISKIFAPYFTTKNENGGTGIGLAFSKKVIEAHRGSLSLQKTETMAGTKAGMGGSTFLIILPSGF